ncbi:hypothetical protein FS749_003132 [Ceratobasidium sp. UAMH 11750]|nr:hypothetical protein FS749_003132 [Ceratobasidium sp. UAMH 11750]
MMFLLALIDEIHALRNINWLWEGVLALMCNSCVRQAASATPIWTGYKDVISALKLLRHPSLIDQRGVVLGDKLEELEKEAGQRWKDTETVEEFSKVIAKKRLQVEQQVVSEESIAESAEVILNVQKKNLRSFFTSYPCISYLKQLLGSVIIRRGIQDLDPDGRPVLKLEPYIESIVYLILTPTESEAIKEISAKKPSSVTGKAGEVAWVNFFIDYRYVTFHWRLLNRKELEIDWKSWTMEDFQEMASSKLRVIIKIIFHYKDNPNAAPLFFARDDGQPAALPVPTSAQLSDEVPHRLVHHGSPSTIQTTAPTITDPTPRKFIIFTMFHIPRQIIRKVLKLHGIQYRELDGTMTIKARNVALKQFLEDEQILVLLMSNVGSVGLNIIRASVLIVVDQPWSYSDLQQILGRAWRKGQQRVVHFYRLIARDTADETMLGYANGKSLMQDHLVHQENLLDCIHGRDEVCESEEDGETNEQGQAGSKSSRGRKLTYVKARPTKRSQAGAEKRGRGKTKASGARDMIEPPTDASLPTEAVISQAKHAASAEQPDPPFSSTSREDPTSKGKAKQSPPPPSNSSEDRGAGSSVSIPTQGSRSQSQADPDTDLVDSLAKVGLLVSSPPTIPVSVPTAPSSPPSPRPLELTDVVNPEMLEEPGTGSSIVEGSPVAIQPDQWRPDSNWGYRSSPRFLEFSPVQHREVAADKK